MSKQIDKISKNLGGFEASPNLDKLEQMVYDNDNNMYKDDEYSDVGYFQFREFLKLKNESKLYNQKRSECISLRISVDTYSLLKKLSSSSNLSQADVITLLLEQFEIKTGGNI